MMEIALISAALMGLVGSVHCAGMCGGIVSALTLGVGRRSRTTTFFYLLAYNVGRIVSYAVAGALAGLVSAQVFQWVKPESAHTIARWVFAGFTIALGLYLTGWWRGLATLERMGAKFWLVLQPFGRRLLPVDSVAKASLIGVVWGWLPCGLVYAALAGALMTGSVTSGALTMAAFGFGTLPTLLLIGAAAGSLRRPLLRKHLSHIAGMVLVAAGFYMLVVPISHSVHLHG